MLSTFESLRSFGPAEEGAGAAVCGKAAVIAFAFACVYIISQKFFFFITVPVFFILNYHISLYRYVQPTRSAKE